ncbi:hypothetical protein AB0D86_43425 [Streptomyces sp. NPDC048324]|uniref:hypothetical protein n=1 Tax=Streptomyces sp. NPDC048324 TaxID=3157205 RepID=UPI003425ECB9
METGSQVPPFEPGDDARVEAAAGDPFLKALREARDRIPLLAEVFATRDTSAADTSRGSWPDPAPMSSRDLYEFQQRSQPRD